MNKSIRIFTSSTGTFTVYLNVKYRSFGYFGLHHQFSSSSSSSNNNDDDYDDNNNNNVRLTFILLTQHIVSELHLTKATRNLNVPYTHAEA